MLSLGVLRPIGDDGNGSSDWSVAASRWLEIELDTTQQIRARVLT